MLSFKILLVSFLASVFLFDSGFAQDNGTVIVRKYKVVPVVTVKNKPGVVEKVARGVQQVGNNVIDLGQNLLTGGKRNSLFGALVGGVADVGKGILGTLTNVVGGVNEAAKRVATGANGLASEVVAGINDKANEILTDAKDIADIIGGSRDGNSTGIVKSVAKGAQKLGNDLIDIGHAVLTGGRNDTLIGGLLGVVGGIGKEIIDTAAEAVVDVNDIARAVASGAGKVANKVVSAVNEDANKAVSKSGVVAKKVLGGQSVEVKKKLMVAKKVIKAQE